MKMRAPSVGFLLALAMGVTLSAHADARRKHVRLKRVALTEAAKEDHAVRPLALKAWVRPHLPPHGSLLGGQVTHHVQRGDSWQSIAEQYVDLTSIYASEDLAKAIVKENSRPPAADRDSSSKGPVPGTEVTIPAILEHAPKNVAIGLPDDGIVKGLYVRGVTASGHGYPAFLERVAAHGMNAIVLDVKDFDGLLTFPSKVPLANESGAVHKPPMRSYSRAVRFAHEKGIRVIARVSCFNDNHMAKAHPSMAIRGISGHVYHNGWVDPKNEIQQQYVVDLAKEAMDNGADEVQLDYVRFPVIGMKNIDYGLDTIANPDAKVEVITNFVERVHKVTHARGIPLSLDVFGVIAFGKVTDIRNLGQDPAILSEHAEFLSPMVYPSHFDAGFMSFDAPADHPELVGMGVRHMNAEIDERGVKEPRAKIRPWASAMRHTASNYGASYIQEELRTSEKHGGSGWLLWNPGQVYDVAWSALPRHTEKNDKSGK
jgi:hypothetical protein